MDNIMRSSGKVNRGGGLLSLASASAVMALLVAMAVADETDVKVWPEQVCGHYVGRIGDNLPIQMDLRVEEKDIAGWYYYEAVGSRLELKGQIKKGNKEVLLDEFLENDDRFSEKPGRKTGTFRGTFERDSNDFSRDSGNFSGTWKAADGKRTLAFRLAKVASYSFLKTQETDIVKATTVYPVMTSPTKMDCLSITIMNHARNDHLKFIASSRKDLDFDDMRLRPYSQRHDISVQYWSDQLVSCLETTELYTGGAHSNTNFAVGNYWVRGDKAAQIEMADLFLKNSDYVKAVSDICLEDLKKQKATWVVDGDIKAFKAADLSAFTVDPQNITIHFEPYAVECYAAGPFEVKVPLRKLDKLIDPSGPLGRFVTK